MSGNQQVVSAYRSLLQAGSHFWLEGTMQGVTTEQAQWQAPGRSAPIGAQYAHAIAAQDFLILGAVGGRAPLAMTSFAGKTGLSKPYPVGQWDEWSKTVQVDLDEARVYAQAVYAAVDDFLSTLSDEDLNREADLSVVGFGMMRIGDFLNTIVLHNAAHTGEIAVLKGLQEAQGYPF